MNATEEKQEVTMPEKKPINAKSRNALLRYMAILFAVAFLVVTMSLVIQMQKSQNTISALNKTSASALENAEQLQSSNRELSDANASLQDKIADLENNLKQSSDKLSRTQTDLETAQKAQNTAQDAVKAYQLLADAIAANDAGNTSAFSAAMESLAPLKDHLTGNAAQLYAQLSSI